MKISLSLELTRSPKPVLPAPAKPSAPEVDDKGYAYIESATPTRPAGFMADASHKETR